MTPTPSEFGAIFSSLTTDLRLLPTVPAWAEVERGLRELRAGTQKTVSVADREAVKYALWVRDFAGLLLRSSDTLANAIISAAAIAAVSPPTKPADKLSAGMRVLSSTLGCRRLTETQVATTAARIRKECAARFTGAGLDAPIPPVRKQSDIDEWTQAIADAVSRARKSIVISPADLRQSRDRAWAKWDSERMMPYLQRQRQVMGVDDLLTCAAQMQPGSVLKAHPEDVTMSDWSGLLVSALSDEVPDADAFTPDWVTAPALSALGLGAHSEPILKWISERARSKRPPAGNETLKAWFTRLPQVESLHGAFVLRRETTSIVSAWLASSTAPVVAITYKEIYRLVGTNLDSLVALLKALDLAVVAIDMPADETAETLGRSLAEKGSFRLLYLYPPGATSPKQPALIGPRGPDEIMPRNAPGEGRPGSLP